MDSGLTIAPQGAYDFISLGALVHRLDPGVIPFRKARGLDIHVSGGEYNVAANLADCFGLKTGVATRPRSRTLLVPPLVSTLTWTTPGTVKAPSSPAAGTLTTMLVFDQPADAGVTSAALSP